MATIGGVHICLPPPVYSRTDEVGPLWTCPCGRRFILEHFYAEDGRWLGAFFDLFARQRAIPAISDGSVVTLPPSIDELVRSVARGHGETSPYNISWVATTRGAASDLIGGGLGARAGSREFDAPVWLFQLHGGFTPTRGPVHVPRRQGSVMHLVVSQDDGMVLDLSIGDLVRDLGRLGTTSVL